MGGIGSGPLRPGGHRRVVEDYPSIDADVLRREGRLQPGAFSVIFIPAAGENIGARAGREFLFLARLAQDHSESVPVRQSIRLEHCPCPFGGERTYFVCSGVEGGRACGRRAIKLFLSGRRFLCRHCLDLAYASQNEDGWARAQRRALKARRRIGGDRDINARLPFLKPKNMHWRTFSRLYQEAEVAQEDAWAAFAASCQRLLAR